MAPPRRLLAFAGAACLSLAGVCQATGISLRALQSQSNMRRALYIRGATPVIRGATPVGLAEHPAAEPDIKRVESAALFREPTVWERYRTEIILVGVAVLLAQSTLIVLLLLQIGKRRRSDETVRRLTRRLIHAGEDERRHLARELHDDIGQRLSLVSVELGSLNWSRAASREDGDQKFEEALGELQAAISDVHNLSHRLHSSKLEHLGLRDALRELCQQIAKRHGLQLDLQIDEISADLNRDVSLCFYRVAQEALSNVVKHSSSSRAAVRLVVSRGVLRLQVMDEGSGFEPMKTPSGLGMVTMEERLRIVGGRLSIASKPGEGTVVTAQVSLALLKHPKSKESRRLTNAVDRQESLTDKQA
jgi:signal transduction histidine kinase